MSIYDQAECPSSFDPHIAPCEAAAPSDTSRASASREARAAAGDTSGERSR